MRPTRYNQSFESADEYPVETVMDSAPGNPQDVRACRRQGIHSCDCTETESAALPVSFVITTAQQFQDLLPSPQGAILQLVRLVWDNTMTIGRLGRRRLVGHCESDLRLYQTRLFTGPGSPSRPS